MTLRAPQTVLAEKIREPFDLVLLSCKAYDLDDAITSFAPAIGPRSAILPLLNGMRHLDVLDARFRPDRVLGGQCVIAVTLDDKRQIVHLNRDHQLSFGERGGAMSDRIAAIATAMTGARFDSKASSDIVQEMWEKWVFLATLAGATCLMRAAVGDIAAAPGGTGLVRGLFDECSVVAAASGHAPRAAFVERALATVTASGSPLTASMLRDVERNAPIEADHIVGDLIRRGEATGALPPDRSLLRIAYANLCAYQARRERTAAAQAA